MVSSIAPILKYLRGNQPPEAQQRIDDVLHAFGKPTTGATNAAPEN